MVLIITPQQPQSPTPPHPQPPQKTNKQTKRLNERQTSNLITNKLYIIKVRSSKIIIKVWNHY